MGRRHIGGGRFDVFEDTPDPKSDNDWVWLVLGGLSLLFILNSCS
ncbi:MAG: hypothetical protein VX529_14965 [Pseudomonadota bacterium]|nr:hypothetical protein [Pseudomonadota bacterium]